MILYKLNAFFILEKKGLIIVKETRFPCGKKLTGADIDSNHYLLLKM